MTPTDISEHAREAFKQLHTQEIQTITEAIQHGINLAVAEKDKRISELERDCKIWVDEVNEQITELQSKDREIERLKLALENSHKDGRSIYEQLAEANAKLAEAEEKILDETRLKEIWIVKASNTADQLSSAQAEIERLKGDIIEDTSAQDAEDRREEESQRLRDLHIGRNI